MMSMGAKLLLSEMTSMPRPHQFLWGHFEDAATSWITRPKSITWCRGAVAEMPLRVRTIGATFTAQKCQILFAPTEFGPYNKRSNVWLISPK
jgi:hypothetical protein